MEKTITLSSYDGAEYLLWDGQKIPFDCVEGIRLNKDGEIRWVAIDSEKYSEYLEQKSVEDV